VRRQRAVAAGGSLALLTVLGAVAPAVGKAKDAAAEGGNPSARVGAIEAALVDRGLILRRGSDRTRIEAPHLAPDSRVAALALQAGGGEDAVVAHGPGGAVLAGPGVAAARVLWAGIADEYTMSDLGVAGPWRHAHRLVDADGDGDRDIVTVSTRTMDTGPERRISAHRRVADGYTAVSSERARTWARATRRAANADVERAIRARLRATGDADVRLQPVAHADIATRGLALGERTAAQGLRWTRTTLRAGTREARLARVRGRPGDGDGRAYLAIVRTIPADALAVLALVELGPYPALRPPGDCIDGLDEAQGLAVRAWNSDSRAIVARYLAAPDTLAARVVRWDGTGPGPILDPVELGTCEGPLHRLELRPGAGEGPPAVRLRSPD